MQTLKINSELQTLLPPLSDAEYKGLETDILEHGCLSPLVTWQDVIIDGHNRYAICQEHELPFDTVELEFDSLDDAKLWAWSHQEHRRNLTPYQRTTIALRFKSMLAAKAKEKESNRKSTKQNSAESSSEKNTRKEIAGIAGVSHDTVARVEYIEKHADDETKQRLRNGETTINREYTRLRIAERDEVAEDELEPMTPTYPNPMDTFQESVTLQHILVHDTESLITCLFSLFDAKYRSQLILDILEKTLSDDGQDAVETMICTINKQFPITQ